jgi:hypothetical protein
MRLAELVFLVFWVAFWIGFAIVAIVWISEVAEVEKQKAQLGPSVLTVLTAFYSK